MAETDAASAVDVPVITLIRAVSAAMRARSSSTRLTVREELKLKPPVRGNVRPTGSLAAGEAVARKGRVLKVRSARRRVMVK